MSRAQGEMRADLDGMRVMLAEQSAMQSMVAPSVAATPQVRVDINGNGHCTAQALTITYTA